MEDDWHFSENNKLGIIIAPRGEIEWFGELEHVKVLFGSVY